MKHSNHCNKHASTSQERRLNGVATLWRSLEATVWFFLVAVATNSCLPTLPTPNFSHTPMHTHFQTGFTHPRRMSLRNLLSFTALFSFIFSSKEEWQLFHEIKRGRETNLSWSWFPSFRVHAEKKEEALRGHYLGVRLILTYLYFSYEIFSLRLSSRGPSLEWVPCYSSNFIIFLWFSNGQ